MAWPAQVNDIVDSMTFHVSSIILNGSSYHWKLDSSGLLFELTELSKNGGCFYQTMVDDNHKDKRWIGILQRCNNSHGFGTMAGVEKGKEEGDEN